MITRVEEKLERNEESMALLVNGYVAVEAELEQGWIKSVNYQDKPKIVKRWCVKHNGAVTHFKKSQLEEGTLSLRQYGFVRTVEKTPEMKARTLSKGKLSRELWEAVTGLVQLMDDKGMIDAKENVPQYVRELGYQRPAVC